MKFMIILYLLLNMGALIMSQLYAGKYVKDEDSEWLVFLHGFAGNSGMWKKQIEFFKGKYNLLILDLPVMVNLLMVYLN